MPQYRYLDWTRRPLCNEKKSINDVQITQFSCKFFEGFVNKNFIDVQYHSISRDDCTNIQDTPLSSWAALQVNIRIEWAFRCFKMDVLQEENVQEKIPKENMIGIYSIDFKNTF